MRPFSTLLKTLLAITLGLFVGVHWVHSKEMPLSFSMFSKLETDFKEFDQPDKSINLILGLGINYKLNKKIALEMSKNFLEVVLAKGFDKEALVV